VYLVSVHNLPNLTEQNSVSPTKTKNLWVPHLEAQVPGGSGPGQPEHMPHSVHIWQIYGALPQQDLTQPQRKLKIREKNLVFV
ncbi:MAG: hypothetical protein ACK559_08145, partial [bacterium]